MKAFFRKYWCFALLALTVLLVFAKTFSFPVMESWDDDIFVTRSVQMLEFSFSNAISFFTSPVLGNYVPLTMLSYMVDYNIGGLDGFMYHFQSVMWHIFAVWGLFACFRFFGISPLFSFLFCLFYAVHPQRVESVAWVAERRDVMCGAFYFWALYFYFKGRLKRDFSLLPFVLFIFSLLSKSVAVSFPVVILMYEFFMEKSFFRLRSYFRALPYFVASALIALTTSLLLVKAEYKYDVAERLLILVHNFSWYILKNVYPGQMAPIYPKVFFSYSVIIKTVSVYIVLLSVMVYMFCRYRRLFLYTVFPLFVCYLASLMPTLGIFPIGDDIFDYADRYSYIPGGIAVFVFVLSAVCIFRGLRDKLEGGFRFIPGLVFGVYILFLGVTSFYYSASWSSYYNLLKMCVLHDPPNRKMLCVYGASLLSRADMTRQLGQASAYLLEGDKDSTDVLGKSTYFTGKALRAVYLYRLERYREAVKLFEEVFKNRRVKLVYNNSAAYRPFYYFAGIAKLRTGDKREAMKYFDNVIALFAGYETETLEFYFYRGSINYYKGRYKEALSDYERALEINPENESVIHNIRKCEKKLSDGK